MGTTYRGPYFRCGADGAGNYWELDQGQQSRRLVIKPKGWELRNPPVPKTIASTHFDLHVDTEAPRDTGVSLHKEYLGPLLESRNEPEVPITALMKPAETDNGGRLSSDRSEFTGTVIGGKKSVEDVLKSQKITDLRDNVQRPEKNFVGLNFFESYVSPREDKMRTFDYFRKMSCDPPTTPPAATVTFDVPESSPVPQGQIKVKPKIRSKKSAAKSESVSGSLNFDPFLRAHELFTRQTRGLTEIPGQPHIQSGWVQETPFRPPLRQAQRSRLSPGEGRRRQEHSLQSMMIVKKVPLVDGCFNDNMQPPTITPEEPPKRVPKKRFDAWRPLNWSHSQHQQERDLMREYIRQYQETTAVQPQPQNKVKGQVEVHRVPSGKVSPHPKPKKPVHPSKQFPVHVPGPKKENMYIGPYVDSETDLLTPDTIKIKPKIEG